MHTKTAGGVTTTYTYDANNRMLTETEGGTTKVYTYDANGNQLTGDGVTYTYNARSQQTGYSKGSVTASYTYLPTGLRKSKTVGITTTNFVWDGQNMVYEYIGTNSTGGTAYYYGLTLISQGNYAYYLYNAHGDVVQLVSSIGSLGLSYIYDAFGNEANPSATDTNPFRYTGQYFDTETGTYYLRARYYDPSVGRFTQQDGWKYKSFADPLKLNLYTYCANNPVMFIDPSGHAWYHWAIAGALVVAAGVAVVLTAGGAAPAVAAVAMVAQGTAAATTTTTIAASVFVSSATALTGGVVAAAMNSDTVDEFMEQGDWYLVTDVALNGAMGYFEGRILNADVNRYLSQFDSDDDTQATLQNIANSVKSPQTGPVSGTKQHSQFKMKVDKLGNPNLKTEVSFLNGKEVKYGTPGSVRCDVVQYKNGKIVAIYDLKTGSAKLSTGRIKEIQNHVAKVPVIEIKPN